MSCVFPFVSEEERSDATEIEALVLMQGGKIVERGARVALAVLDARPAILLMEGPRAGMQAWLMKTGISSPRDICGLVPPEGAKPTSIDARDGQNNAKVYDLTGGEVRLSEVMERILVEIGPQISGQIAREATGQLLADLTGSGMATSASRVWRNKAECLDTLAPLLETGQASLVGPYWAEVVDFLSRNLTDELRDRMKVVEGFSMAHLVLATPGLGKTRSVQTMIEALPPETVVWVFQPTLRKADEFARDMAGSSRPVQVFRGRGASVEDGAAERMCRRHVVAAEIAAKGLSVKKMLCGSSDQSVGGTCPDSAACAYQAQIKAIGDHKGGGVFVMTHASLTRPPPFCEPHLVIIDEDPSAILPQSIKVSGHIMTAASDWANLLYDDCEDLPLRAGLSEMEACDQESGDSEESREAVMLTFERLLEALATAAPLREITATIDIAELDAALRMVRGLERKLRAGPKPEGRDEALQEVLNASVMPELLAVMAVLTAILQEVRLANTGVIDRPEFNGLSICIDDDGKVRSVTVHRLARTAIKSAVPMIVLDGTADPLLIGRALRRQMAVWRIDVKRQGEVVQCLGRGFSNASLVPTAGYPLPPSATAERERLWQDLTSVLRREIDATPGRLLVVSTLAVETEARQRQCCNDLFDEKLAWTHFGATRGINSFTDCQTIVLIGRKQPPATAVKALARAYFALDPKPFDPTASEYVVRHRTLHGKAGQFSSTIIQVHPDSRANRILWQMREAEVIQAIDRVRAARFVRRILILNALDLHRPDDDLGRADLGVPANLHLSWPELRNGGNRAGSVIATSKGFLPVAPKALARIAPEIFPSAEAAKKWLHRTDLDEALVCHRKYLTRLKVRPTGQRGPPWPLILDRRHHACPSAARTAFEAMLGATMAIWVSAD